MSAFTFFLSWWFWFDWLIGGLWFPVVFLLRYMNSLEIFINLCCSKFLFIWWKLFYLIRKSSNLENFALKTGMQVSLMLLYIFSRLRFLFFLIWLSHLISTKSGFTNGLFFFYFSSSDFNFSIFKVSNFFLLLILRGF